MTAPLDAALGTRLPAAIIERLEAGLSRLPGTWADVPRWQVLLS